jgi:hypothetical protein
VPSGFRNRILSDSLKPRSACKLRCYSSAKPELPGPVEVSRRALLSFGRVDLERFWNPRAVLRRVIGGIFLNKTPLGAQASRYSDSGTAAAVEPSATAALVSL